MLKFTGNFRDLKKMGFRFRKLFASNYKNYNYTAEKYDSSDIDIWVARREFDINSLGSLSEAMLDHILNTDIKDNKETILGSVFKRRLVINLSTKKVEYYDDEMHDHMNEARKRKDAGNPMSIDERMEHREKFRELYRTNLDLSDEVFLMVREMYNNGLIERAEKTVDM